MGTIGITADAMPRMAFALSVLVAPLAEPARKMIRVVWYTSPDGNRFYLGRGAASPLGRIVKAGLVLGSLGPPPNTPLGSYAVVYSLEGEAIYRDNTARERHIAPGDVILVFPEQKQWYFPKPGHRWSEFYLVFEGAIFDAWREQGLLDSQSPFLHCEPVEYWHSRLAAVPDAGPGTEIASTLVEVCRLQLVLADMIDQARKGPEMSLISRACELLESEKFRRSTLPAIAKKLGVSYERFRKDFARIMGSSPARYRAARIIEHACELLLRTTLRDKEIAAELGFVSEYHFSRRFKQITGTTPTAFRRHHARQTG
jgi:AraC-like DNA-binding protein